METTLIQCLINFRKIRCNPIRASIIVFFSFSYLCNAQSQQKSGDLKIIFNNIKNTKGSLEISLYNSPNGFPSQSEKALKTEYLKIKNGSMEFVFKNVPFGVYAIGVYHDENDNKKMDRNFLGIPKEGIGVSNNAKGNLGPPKFDDAKISFTQTENVITISISYF